MSYVILSSPATGTTNTSIPLCIARPKGHLRPKRVNCCHNGMLLIALTSNTNANKLIRPKGTAALVVTGPASIQITLL